MPPILKLYEPPLDDGDDDEQETSLAPVRRESLDVAFVFAVCLLIGGSASVLLWAVSEMFVP